MRTRTTKIGAALLVCCLWRLEPSTVLCLPSRSRSSQTIQTAEIDSYIARQMKVRQIPGLALAIVQRGNVILKREYGIANLETDTPVRTNSVFELASVTKQFTAAAIMLLVEEKLVTLDEPIGSYIVNTPDHWKNITIRHLLTHTAGLQLGAIVWHEGSPLLSISTKQAFDFIANTRPLYHPGERALYSDAGYFLLGMVIETASKQSYREFMQKRIFDPLQMKNSSIIDKRKIIKNHVTVYGIRDGELSHWMRDFQYELPSFYGVLSTIDDLVKWDLSLRDKTLLKQSSLDQMWTPATLANGQHALVFGDAYGFGWALGEIRSHRIAGHPGASGTYLLRFLDDDLTIILLTNLDSSASQPGLLARGIAGLVNRAYRPPQMLSPRPDPTPEATRNVRTLLSDLGDGHDSPVMTSSHRDYYNSIPQPVRQDQARVLKALRSLTYLECDDVEARGLRISESVTHIRYYKAELGDRVFYFTFWFNKDGKIALLRFTPE